MLHEKMLLIIIKYQTVMKNYSKDSQNFLCNNEVYCTTYRITYGRRGGSCSRFNNVYYNLKCEGNAKCVSYNDRR